MGCSIVVIKKNGWIQLQVNSTLHFMRRGGTSLVKGIDHIIKLENYCYSFMLMVLTDTEKNSSQKVTMTRIHIIRPNHCALHAGKYVLFRQELWLRCSKKQLQRPKPNFLKCKGVLHLDTPMLTHRKASLYGHFMQLRGPSRSKRRVVRERKREREMGQREKEKG